MPNQVLHVDFISLNATAPAGTREGIIGDASGLVTLEGVLSVTVIEAAQAAEPDFDLALLFLLQDFSRLEPFGTAEPYSRFLQARVAPLLQGFSGADVQLEQDFPSTAEHAACLALAAPPQTYDWEVRELLGAWAGGLDGTASVYGLAIGDRQRYRGLAVAFSPRPVMIDLPEASRFGKTVIAGNARTL